MFGFHFHVFFSIFKFFFNFQFLSFRLTNRIVIFIFFNFKLSTMFRRINQNIHQIRPSLEFPESAIGKNTAHALQAGILLGYVGLVNEILDHTIEELGGGVKVIATGGLSAALPPLRNRFDAIDPVLTLDGLRIILEQFGGD